MDEQIYRRIVAYLRTKTTISLAKNKKDSLRKKCKNFVLNEGLLTRDVGERKRSSTEW